MNIGDFFNSLFLIPIINLLVGLYRGIDLINIPGALGFALIMLTVLIRVLVWPLMSSQIRSMKKMSDLKPHMDELKKRHSGDKQALAQAQMSLYKEHGVNPAGGCLPAIIQIPIFIGLYQAITNIFPNSPSVSLDWINSILYFPWMHLQNFPDPIFFGLNLGVKPSEFAKYGPFLIIIPLVTALLTFVQSKMTMPKPIKPYPSDSPKEIKEKQGQEDTMAAVQSQMVFLMPIMIGYFAFSFPIGLAIYWNTYTIVGIFQQYQHTGWGGMVDIIGRIRRRN